MGILKLCDICVVGPGYWPGKHVSNPGKRLCKLTPTIAFKLDE